MNVLKTHLRITIETLMSCGVSHREIEQRTGVDRNNIRRSAVASKSPGVATVSDGATEQTPPPRPPALPEGTSSSLEPSSPTGNLACEPHRAWVEAHLVLERNGVSVYQDLVEQHGFGHRYTPGNRVRIRYGPELAR